MFWKDTRQKQRQGNNSNFQILLNAGVRELTNNFAEIKKSRQQIESSLILRSKEMALILNVLLSIMVHAQKYRGLFEAYSQLEMKIYAQRTQIRNV